MTQHRIPAVYMRGGSSRGLFFKDSDLPKNKKTRKQILLGAFGSPDPHLRQLDGLGAGISSLSKAVIISPPTISSADIDCFFCQISVDQAVVDVSSICGNLASAVGPFAIDQGLIQSRKKSTKLKIHIVNTGQLYQTTFETEDGLFQESGRFQIPGVSGSGSKITLDFFNPCGATTGELLPTNQVLNIVKPSSKGPIEVSLIDATTGMVFVNAEDFGYTANESYSTLEHDRELMDDLEEIRRASGVLMGISTSETQVPLGNPRIALIGPSKTFKTLANKTIKANAADIAARVVSMGQLHRAIPLSSAMCLAAACCIDGSIPNRYLKYNKFSKSSLRLSNPSGVINIKADVCHKNSSWMVNQLTAYRTARTLMEGVVCVPK